MAAGTRSPRSGADGGEALQRAAFALNAKHPEEAQQIAEEILRREPRNARALHILGFALLMQGRAEAAISPLEAAARGRHDPEIETQLALALSQLGKRDDALSRLKRASKRQPPYAPAFHGLGSLLFAMARYDEAIEALRRGVAVAPDDAGDDYSTRQRLSAAGKISRTQGWPLVRRCRFRRMRPTRCSAWAKLCMRWARAKPPPIFRHCLGSGPMTTAYGFISDIVCYSSASARPATSVFVPRRAAIRGATAERFRRSLHRAAAEAG